MQVWTAIISIGVVCTFYTTVGGMKAVLWADTLQMVIMFAGQIAIVIQGCVKAGGVYNVWQIAERGGRINFWNTDPNPISRASIWVFLIGGAFRVFNSYISTQFLVQRYCTVRTPRHATITVYLNIPMFLIIVTLFTAIGMVMFAVYHDCDPLLDGRIQRRDQMVPLFVLELLSIVPGVPGLFMACVFSASLSSLSSGINGLSANTLRDIVAPIYEACTNSYLEDKTATLLAKLFALAYGMIIMGLSFLILGMGSSIFALTTKVVGMIGSPMAGVFVIGILTPKVKTKSVIAGFVVSAAVSLWWGLGAMFVPPYIPEETLPVYKHGCLSNITVGLNESAVTTFDFVTETTTGEPILNTTNTPLSSFKIEDLYHLSPLYFAPLGCILTVVVSLIVHCVTVLVNMCYSRGKGDYNFISIQRESQVMHEEGFPAVDEVVMTRLKGSDVIRSSSVALRYQSYFEDQGSDVEDGYNSFVRQNSSFRIKKRERDHLGNIVDMKR